MVKVIGYIVLGLSILIWGLIFVIPWLGFSAGKIVGITTGLVIAGEITFYLSLFLIGKEYFAKIMSKLKFWRSKSKPESTDFPQ
jgi:hypothetical protein